ncbi:hypothetical protein CJJ13_03940 [Serratia fonticola]|nr:hypothetical protein CJJ13_03940 [Serratia fonticola]
MLLEFLKFAPHPNPLPQGEGADLVTFIKILPHISKAGKAKISVHPNVGLTLSHKGEGTDSVTVINILPHFDKEYEGMN